jgi:hypothetical protein
MISGPQPPAGLQPAEAGHHHVEDQQIQRVTAHPGEHGETVGDAAGVITLDLEHPLQRLPDGRIIIRDHDPHGPPLPVEASPLIVPGSTLRQDLRGETVMMPMHISSPVPSPHTT